MEDALPLAQGVDEHAQPVAHLAPVDGPQPPIPGLGGQASLEHGRQGGFVDLHDERRAGHEPLDVGDVPGDPVGERADDVTPGTGVGEGPLAPGQLDARTEGPRPGDLQLQPPGPPVVGLGELVEVLPQEGAGPPFVPSRTVGEAPPVGLGLDVEVGEERRPAPDDLGADAARGQLRQVRDALSEEVTDGDDGFARARPRPGPDAGGERHARASVAWPAERYARAIVPEPTTRVPS